MNKCLSVLALVLATTLPLAAQQTTAEAKAEVLVLGVYHMANPGHDVFNMQADDVLSPKRQAEVAVVIDMLKKFHPTKIALEFDPHNDRLAKRYADYVAGKYDLSRNEIDQLGLRLAKELGHQKIYGVDADGDFPWLRLSDYAEANGHAREFDDIKADIGRMVKEQDAYLASHSVVDTLLFMNSDEHVARDVGLYYREGELGDPYDWAGADLLAEWFRRNARIYTNTMHLIDSPNERVLVIFGAGHLGWLRHDFASNSRVRLRKLAEFAHHE